MQVGIGLPATLPGVAGDLVIEWARRADDSPFASLGVFDRTVYDNLEPMTALAAAAAVTRRVLLATSVLIAPLRSTALIAQQAATVQRLSGGRLVLGVGLGARPDDYAASGADYSRRGRTLTAQLAGLHACWEGGEVGPPAPPPRLLVGGAGGTAMLRVVRFAAGAIHNGGPPRAFARAAAEARAAWEHAERPGSPELWGMGYYALGGCAEAGAAYLRHYYAFTGPFADRIAAGLLTSRQDLLDFCEGYADAGCGHLLLFPTVAAADQFDRLAEIVAA